MTLTTLVQAAVALTQQQLQAWAADAANIERSAIAFDDAIDLDKLTQLIDQWAAGNFAVLPEIALLSANEMGNAVDVAFSPGSNTVYLAETWVLANADTLPAIASGILQGFGYAVDHLISPQDSSGDEGRIFSLLVQDVTLDPATLAQLKAEPSPAELAVPQVANPTVLQLQVGPNGGDWVANRPDLGPIANRAEQIVAESVVGGVQVSGYGVTQTDWGSFTQIFADAGGGDDEIDLSNIDQLPVSVLGGTGNDWIVSGGGADVLEGGAGDDRLAGGANNDRITGGPGRDVIVINRGDGADAIADFGGVGLGARPPEAVIAEVDTLQLSGENLTPEHMLLTQVETDLVITFANVSDVSITLKDFALEHLDNLPTCDESGQFIGNILFDGDTTVQDRFDVFDAEWQRQQLLNRNTVTFLNDLDNTIWGFDRSDDVVNAQGGNDVVRAFGGDDTLRGGEGDDTLFAGSGDDRLLGGEGSDELDGGAGRDVVSYRLASGGIIANLTAGAGARNEAAGDRYIDIEDAEGSNDDDLIFGDHQRNFLWGLAGNDRLEGRAGNDQVLGGTGQDTLFGGEGEDVLAGGADHDVLNGGDGNDQLQGEAGDDRLWGDAGNDQLSGQTGNDTLSGGEDDDTLSGGEGNDVLNGDAGRDHLNGGDHDDVLSGGQGADRLFGDAGSDRIEGGDDNDILSGGEGDDALLTGGLGNDTIFGDSGNDLLKGDAGQDFLSGGEGDDVIEGGDDDDEISGGQDNDVLFGGAGRDRLFGDLGNDLIFGEFDNDELNGNAGQDTLEGGWGDDQLNGGEGDDELSGGNDDDVLSGHDGHDLLAGDEGDDVLIGAEGNDHLDGGSGIDAASYLTSVDRVIVNLDATQEYDIVPELVDLLPMIRIDRASAQDGFGSFDSIEIIPEENIVTVENIIGSKFDDVFIGDRQNNDIQGLAGDDFFLGSSGNDNLDGGKGIDTVSYHQATAAVVVDLDVGIAVSAGSTDSIAHIENIIGTRWADSISGASQANQILAGLGNDQITGGGNQDTFIIYLDEGIDTITDFGGIGQGVNPAKAIRAEVDVIKFVGSGLTARNMVLTQIGENLEIAFENSVGNTIFLEDFRLENLENLPADKGTGYPLGNLWFDGQSQLEDSFDVLNADAVQSQVFARNQVTFLNALDNDISGFEDSDDVINAQAGNDLVRGLSGDDVLRGEAGDDTLVGGAGNDTLVGGLGADLFQLNPPTEGIDRIEDFSAVEGDFLLISADEIGSELSLGTLDAEAFTIGLAASRASDRFVYNPFTGSLYFDADGTGPNEIVKIAQMSENVVLEHSSIWLV